MKQEVFSHIQQQSSYNLKRCDNSYSEQDYYFLILFCSNNPTHKYFLAVDPVNGALFISDTNSRRIYRVRSLTGGRLLSDNAEVVAGTGEQCLPFDERCGDGGKATEATLMSPKGDDGILRLTLKERKKRSSRCCQ